MAGIYESNNCASNDENNPQPIQSPDPVFFKGIHSDTCRNVERARSREQDRENCPSPHGQNSIMSLDSRLQRQPSLAVLSSCEDAESVKVESGVLRVCHFPLQTPSKPSTISDGEGSQSYDDDDLMSTAYRLTHISSGLSSINNDWDAPSNFENPHNWSLWKKIYHTALPALYGFVLTIGTSAYVPAIPLIMFNYNVSREIALLPLAFYTFGFTVGPLIYAPISEIYGRRIVYWVSMPLLMLFTAICGASNNITLLIVMRFFSSLSGSGALAVGAGTILDIWSKEAQGRAAIGFILAPFLGPCLGPLIGAYIISTNKYDWRWSMWIVMIIATPIAIISVFMQETSKSRIMYLRAEEAMEGKIPRRKGDTLLYIRKLRQALTRPFHMMFFEPLVALLSIYTGFAFAMLFSFFASYNFVFLVVYHFDQRQIGFTFLGILVGFIFAVASFSIFDVTIYRREFNRTRGDPAPEHRLYAAMVGSIMLPIGLFWFAWTPRVTVHWIVPVMAGVPFGWGTLGIFISATAYLVDVYKASNSASAIAANGILRYSLGAAFPLFTIQLYTALGIHWAGSIFAFLSLVMTPVPWVFFWKGKLLRAKSSYDTNSA